MAQTSRIVCRVAVKTVADRRLRAWVAIVPPKDLRFTEEEQEVFRGLDRRLRRT